VQPDVCHLIRGPDEHNETENEHAHLHPRGPVEGTLQVILKELENDTYQEHLALENEVHLS
jgi:hypothetical protein